MNKVTNRDEAREYFAHRGMRYTSDPAYTIAYPIHWGDMMRLWQMCEDHISEAELEMHMRPNPKIKRIKFRDQVCEAYLRVDGPYFTNREAISFNSDQFIGFAGWATDKNVKPFISAFVEWVDWFVAKYGERAAVSNGDCQSEEIVYGATPEQVDSLDESERGQGGFSSTGVRL